MPKPKKKMTPAEKAAARVPEPLPVASEPKPPAKRSAPATRNERRGRLGLLIGTILVIIVVGFAIWVGNYSHADEAAQAAMQPTAQVAVDDERDWIAFGDPAAQTGYVFYPGGKVQAESYAPLMQKLAEEDVFCVVAKMPFNISFFKTDAADDIIAAFPQVKTWYVGGHSLGGVTACQWAEEHADEVAGIVLLASYPSVDLSQSGLRMLQVYGSADGVMNQDNLAESRALQPADTKSVVIEGGNHAQFGSYGAQDGDGEAAISADEQRAQAVAIIVDWLARG